MRTSENSVNAKFAFWGFCEVRISTILGSWPPEMATWQMPHPLCVFILALVTSTQAGLRSPALPYGRSKQVVLMARNKKGQR